MPAGATPALQRGWASRGLRAILAAVPHVDVALATFNCEPWLDELFQSLLAQQGPAWRLVARDDGSTDGSAQKLAGFAAQLGPRALVLPGSGNSNLGVVGCFNALFAATAAPHVATADGDDFWLPGRLQRTISALEAAERAVGAHTPVAVCTDAEVISSTGAQIAPSYWRWQRMDPARSRGVRRVAMESVALGSTMAVNRALLELALPIPPSAPYQDWWLALVAAAFGRLVALPDRTIRYRRHAANETSSPIGSDLGAALRRALASPAAPRARLAHVVGQASRQAAAFEERFRSRLGEDDVAAMQSLAGLAEMGALTRRAEIVRHGLWFASPLKNAGLLALI
jgi:hypothetical protein